MDVEKSLFEVAGNMRYPTASNGKYKPRQFGAIIQIPGRSMSLMVLMRPNSKGKYRMGKELNSGEEESNG